MLTSGVRIVRGPDWSWANQDGGEGNVGTVCEIGKSGTVGIPEKTVVVQWDNGTRTNYRVGYLDKYDLYVIDNAQIGVKHPNIVCDGCKSQGIAGMRYKCSICYDFDLCYMCYHSDIHDLTHSFKRFDSATSSGIDLPVRKNGRKAELKGIFVNAKVVRGFNWEWGNQDGGDGKIGRVLDIRGWDNESCRSVANVTWLSGSTNVYRLGHKGNCDIKFVESSTGGTYYPEHLPVLRQSSEQYGGRSTRATGPPPFNVGDKVQVIVTVEQLKQMQQGHGGWNPRMAEYIGKVGNVHRVTDKRDIRVQYDGCNNRWTFNPTALIRVNSYAVGDVVSVINDSAKVRELQKGHGEWIDIMRNALGKLGKVLKVYADGDLRVQLDGHAWTLNPQCVRVVPGSAAELANTMHASQNQRQEPVMHWQPGANTAGAGAGSTNATGGAGGNPSGAATGSGGSSSLPAGGGGAGGDNTAGGTAGAFADQLVKAAAQGNLDTVQRLLYVVGGGGGGGGGTATGCTEKIKVDVRSGGKTALQVAAHQGHLAIVQLLLQAGAAVNACDGDGDTCLHYAAFGNQPEVLELLIAAGVELNVANRSGCTALHIAAHKQPARSVQILLTAGSDPNCMDLYGDTALHDAIGKDSFQVIELLCAAPATDFTLRNKRGFNVLHHASLKGKTHATRTLLSRARQLVDVKKDDGFAALHLAALNGHRDVCGVLVRNGHADIDLRNNRQQSPLLLAVSQGHCGVVELLVGLGATVNVRDEDGDSALHLVLMKRAQLTGEVARDPDNTTTAGGGGGAIYTIHEHIQSQVTEYPLAITLACYLVQAGCDLDGLNAKSQPALHLLTDTSLQELVKSYKPSTSTTNNTTTTTATSQQQQLLQLVPLLDSNQLQHVVENNLLLDALSVSQESTSSGGSGGYVRGGREGEVGGGTEGYNVMHAIVGVAPVTAGVEEITNNQAGMNTIACSKRKSRKEKAMDLAGNSSQENSPNHKSNHQHHHHHLNHHQHNLQHHLNHLYQNESITSPPVMTSNKSPVITTHTECLVCSGDITGDLAIRLEPCGHRPACAECAARMRKCLQCTVVIRRRVTRSGRVVSPVTAGTGTGSQGPGQKPSSRQSSAERLKYLEGKIAEIEESNACGICMERRRNVVFLCGHGTCGNCAETLRTCHMCRKTITKKISIY